MTSPMPRDDRVMPRAVRVLSAASLAAAAAWVFALARDADPDTRPWVVVACSAVVLALSVGTSVAAMPAWLRGEPTPRRFLLVWAVLLLLVVAAFGFGRSAGWGALVGLFAGMIGAGLVTVPMARRNRGAVDAAWAERQAAEASRPLTPSTPDGPPAPVGRALRLEVFRSRRAVVSAFLALVVVTAVAYAVWRSTMGMVLTASPGVALLALELRGLWGRQVSVRAYEAGRDRPRVAWVSLLNDPNPRAVRPLLAVWDERPVVGPGRYPVPDRVYRADVDADDLLSFQGAMTVHEAWVDPALSRGSTPRWVAADSGIAIVHRRAILGRWYFGSISRGERSGPLPLTIGAPDPMLEIGDPPPPWSWPKVGSLTGRTAFLAAWAVVAHLIVRGS